MILATPRLTLRPTLQSDATALFAILGDAEAMAFWHRPALPRLATVEALLADELAAMAAGGFHYWTVTKDGEAIGSIDLSCDNGASAWAGFLFRRDLWAKGYAGESLTAVINHAFGPLRLGRLMARVQAGNLRAARLLEGQGFHKEGMLPDVMREDGPRACALYGLNRSSTRNGI
jgi:[ribosomal protein S5]-alanine N-acetyltransferase